MPRSQRLNQAGLLHHVIARGNANETLFKDQEDFRKYLALLRQATTTFPLAVYNYALLGNYLHLLVETKKEGALSKAMEMVTKEYAKYFNAKYNREGHVFNGRFKSFCVQPDQYFMACSRYIDELIGKNNLGAPKDYQWCGHKSLAYGETGEYELDQHPLYEQLGSNDQERQLVYRTLVQQKLGPELDLDNRKAGILGSKEFKQSVKPGKKGSNNAENADE